MIPSKDALTCKFIKYLLDGHFTFSPLRVKHSCQDSSTNLLLIIYYIYHLRLDENNFSNKTFAVEQLSPKLQQFRCSIMLVFNQQVFEKV